MDGWNRGEKIGLYSLSVAVIGVLVGLLTLPEFRQTFGLHQGATVKPTSTEANSFNSRASSSPSPGASPGRKVTSVAIVYVVHGTDEWHGTQMVVTKGQWVSVSAVGSVVWDPTLPAVGPDGALSASSLQNASDFPMPNARCGALIMRIGDTKYVIGSTATIQAENDGKIEFMINDRIQSLGDNSGVFTVEIKLGGH
jgi:hypothetical protein